MTAIPLSVVLKERGRLTPLEIVKVMLPLTEGLSSLHAHGHRHGNLCPSHVFVEPDDLELSWLYDTLLTLNRSIPSPVNASRMVMAEYLCPERIRGRRGTVPSDIYGSGILMYELLMGAPPFSGASYLETRRLHLETSAEPPLDNGLGLADIIMRCLSKEPSLRFPDAGALAEALSAITHGRPRGTETMVMDASTLGQLKAQVGFAGPQGTAQANPSSERLGDYELLDLLGQGGMGRVFLARNVHDNRQVALKVLRAEMAKDPANLNRFLNEATMVSRIHHPHIVEVYDLVHQEDHAYCVMEPLRGQTLGELLHQKPLKLRGALRIMRQVCEALDAAHHVGVIHRDVKPDNIFLCERPEGEEFVKLLDFGVAKQQTVPDANADFLMQTQGGVMVGTPMFMAPEQALGATTDERTDIYIVATVLYRVIAGTSPFFAQNVQALISQLLTQAPPPLPTTNEAGEIIPADLAQAVVRCLEKDPNKRFQSMKEFIVALAAVESALVTA